MSAYGVITLDTTPPVLSVESSRDIGDISLVTLQLTASEEHEVRVWGDIDPTDPANGSYGETEGAADWIEFADELQVRIRPDAARLYVRARDDVWNESEPVTVALVTAPPEAPRVRPAPGRPRRPAPIVISSRSSLRVQSHVRLHRSVRARGTVHVASGLRHTEATGRSHASTWLRSATRGVSATRRESVVVVESRGRYLRVVDRPDDEDFLAALDVL